MTRQNSLVSVGIPTFNRPKKLLKTLESITNQTYKNLEIIISDNCSPNKEEVEKVIRKFAKTDDRIKYYKQETNKGPFLNFNYLLKKAKGEYFMWAADDDQWEDFYIQDCVNEFQNNKDKNIVAVNTEAQYFFEDQLFDFIPEGKPFYDKYDAKSIDRLLFMVENQYGNLFYSLYKRKYLFNEQGQTIFEQSKSYTLNELPVFLLISQRGQWRIIPKVGFRKSAPESVYKRVKWQNSDKKNPAPNTEHLYKMLGHYLEGVVLGIYELVTVVDKLTINDEEKIKLKNKIVKNGWQKFEYYLPYSPQRDNWDNDSAEKYINELKVKFDNNITKRYITPPTNYTFGKKLKLKIKKYLLKIAEKL